MSSGYRPRKRPRHHVYWWRQWTNWYPNMGSNMERVGPVSVAAKAGDTIGDAAPATVVTT